MTIFDQFQELLGVLHRIAEAIERRNDLLTEHSALYANDVAQREQINQLMLAAYHPDDKDKPA